MVGTASAELPLIAAHHFTSCLDVYLNGGDHGATAPTGKYTIYPNGGAAVDVYCDMSDTGGWTKFMQYKTIPSGSQELTLLRNERQKGGGDLAHFFGDFCDETG